jgi:hypothetical protein
MEMDRVVVRLCDNGRIGRMGFGAHQFEDDVHAESFMRSRSGLR